MEIAKGLRPFNRAAQGCLNLRLVVGAIWGLVCISGCSTLGTKPDAIRVTVSHIALEEATLLEQLYTVTVRVQNHSGSALGVRGGSFDLAINGREFGSGVSNAKVDIGAFEDAQIELRIVSTLFGMMHLIQGMQAQRDGVLSYEISGRIAIEGSLTGLSFREQGEFGPGRTVPGERLQPP